MCVLSSGSFTVPKNLRCILPPNIVACYKYILLLLLLSPRNKQKLQWKKKFRSGRDRTQVHNFTRRILIVLFCVHHFAFHFFTEWMLLCIVVVVSSMRLLWSFTSIFSIFRFSCLFYWSVDFVFLLPCSRAWEIPLQETIALFLEKYIFTYTYGFDGYVLHARYRQIGKKLL